MYPYIGLAPTFAISTYYLVISATALVASLWFLRRTAAHKLSRIVAIDFTLVTLACGFLGARLLHVFYEEPAYYIVAPFRILEVWNGGFVYLGGLLGAALGAAFFCDWKREPFWLWADLAAPPAALAYALGRIGCFLNGCCYGHECLLPWAVSLNGVPRHPTQIYATLWELSVVAMLLLMERRLKNPGALFGLWLILHAFGRIILEQFRGDPRGPAILSLSISTWISIGLLIGGLILMWNRRTKAAPELQ